MGVVIHGSFDEGPIALALPPIFEGLLPEGLQTEVDPIFTTWDRSRGITINKLQIIDRSDIITTDGANGTTNISTIVTGSNTGDQDLSGRIPYTGASGNVDLGTNTLDAERVYVNQETPVASTELATKGYVDAQVFNSTGDVTPTIAHNDTTGKEGGANGHWYHLSDTQIVPVLDSIDESNPDAPTGLTGTSGIELSADGHEIAYVSLSWTAPALSTLDHYHVIYKSATQPTYTQIDSATTSITIHGLVTGAYYSFQVAAVNKAGILSPYSTVFSLNVAVGTEPPATVTGVVAYPAIQAVLVKWTDNIESNLSTYNIYRNTSNSSASSTKIASWKGTTYMDNNLAVNTAYYYWIKALNFGGLESTDYSDVATATTRMVLATDIYNIAANQVIIQGTTTFADLISPGTTTIDGDNITTGTITLNSIDFSSTQAGGGIIGHINSTPENGVGISATLLTINGSSVFVNKVGGSYVSANAAPAVRIFPSDNPDVGIQVVDSYARDVFKINIGGTNIGDVIIGNYNLGEGIRYNAATQTTSFKGTINAYAGSIGGWTINSTALYKDSGVDSAGMSLIDNYFFYAGNTYVNRATAPFRVISNGWTYINHLAITSMNDYTVCRTGINGIVTNSNITDDGTVRMTGASGGLVIPVVTSTPTAEIGKIIFYAGKFWGSANGITWTKFGDLT
jgi:hypothetical protein